MGFVQSGYEYQICIGCLNGAAQAMHEDLRAAHTTIRQIPERYLMPEHRSGCSALGLAL
jgi:hypothetical protein